jgi:hypothetical protein
MNEYIDRDALRQAVLESWHDNPHPRGMAHIAHDCEHAHFVAMIARFPAANVAPVTRCKDCANSYENAFGRVCAYSIFKDCIVPEDFYCASSKPKEGAE